MYCNACGHPNPDGSAFCSSCGKSLNTAPVSSAPQAAPTPQPSTPAPRTIPAYSRPVEQPTPKQAFEGLFRKSWRELATSPLALVLIITHSVSVLLNALELNSALEHLGTISDWLSILSYAGIDLFESAKSTLTTILLICCAPGILIAVGMWILYMDSRDLSPSRPIKITGFALIKGVMIGLIVVFYLVMLLYLLASCSVVNELNNYSSSAGNIGGIIFFIVLIACIGVGIFYRYTLLLIDTVRESAEYCSISTSYVQGFAVVEFIFGGLSAIGMLATGISLSLLVSCVLPFLFGAMLLKYKELMEHLYSQRKAITPPAPKKEASNVMQWARMDN